MDDKRKIEIFSAGCGVCDETIQMVKEIACESCEIEILDMKQEDIAKRAKEYGIKTVPSIVIDGKLADCCENRSVDVEALKAVGVGVQLDCCS